MVTAEASTGGGRGQEQIPEARNVRPRPSSSAAWEYFTQFTAGDGRRKARCKKCNRVFAADTKTNGKSRLLRHAGTCYQLQMASGPCRAAAAAAAAPVLLPSPSCAPSSNPDEHEMNQLVMNASSVPPPPLSLPGDHQPSSPSASFFDDLPLPVPPPIAPPATAQLSIDPPPPPLVLQNDPPPQPLLPCPPLSHSDDEVLLPDRGHGQEDDEEANNRLLTSHPEDENDGPNQLVVTTTSVNAGSDSPSSSSNNLASFRPHEYHILQPTLLSQPHYQRPSSSTSSYPTDLPPTPACDPSLPASPQHCIDPPLPVPQTDPLPSTSNDRPPPPSMSCPPSQLNEVLPDGEHGLEDDEEASNHLARLIALHGYDPALVEDDCFRSFVASLNPEFKLPSRLAVEEMCDGIFDETRKDLISKLSRSDGKVSLAVGTAQTIHGEVLYTTCHFIDDEWNLHQVVLDAYQVVHIPMLYGPLLGVSEVALQSEFCDRTANVILRDLVKLDLLDKLFVMVWSIKDSGELQRPLKQFISVDTTVCVDKALHAIAGPPIILDPNFTENIYRKVQGLDLTRESRQQHFSQISLDHLLVYGQHWYSCYCSLEFLRKHGSCTIADEDYSQLIELLCKIWGVIYHAIQRISTSRHPTSNQCLVELFKVREVLQSQLERTNGDNSIVYRGCSVFIKEKVDVSDVLREAKDTLDSIIIEDYNLLVWSVPLVLDPRYKLTYIKFIFNRAFGSAGARYISKVTRKIKKLYADYVEYDAGINGAGSGGVRDETAVGTDPLEQAWDEHCRSGGGNGMNDVASSHLDVEEELLEDHAIGSGRASTSITNADPLGQAWDKHCRSQDGTAGNVSYQDADKELDRYLNDPRVEATQDFDILNWWKVNSSRYPTVAQMARDALAMPTCSKLSSEQMAHVNSIVRGYSKKKYRQARYEL